jgi:hypothetical protein
VVVIKVHFVYYKTVSIQKYCVVLVRVKINGDGGGVIFQLQ